MAGKRWIWVLLSFWILGGCGAKHPIQEEESIVPLPQTTKNESKEKRQEGFSLSTYEWDYNPWMKEFTSHLNENWQAPEAYINGEISGAVFLKITVERNGDFSEILVTKNSGHMSFVEASIKATEKISGLLPLPNEFANEELVISFGMHYPEFRK